MEIVNRLRQVVHELEQERLEYALAGGLVASLYRKHPRATADIDLVIFTDVEAQATRLLTSLGLKASPIRQASLEGGPMFAIKRKSTPVFLVCGRAEAKPNDVGVDLILSNVPWAKSALERAQANRVDFGFGDIPCITREDLVLAKLYSIGNQSTRFMDLDDLRSIFEQAESKPGIDLCYVRDQMKRLGLSIPDALLPFVPKLIKP